LRRARPRPAYFFRSTGSGGGPPPGMPTRPATRTEETI
jgi:hypothetical protein